jgi:hypothetical protein
MERSPLAAWESFYVIVGSAGAALTGLQFVVIALVAESRRRSTSKEIRAFSTPNVVHFCAVLLMSAIITAPWRGLSRVGLALGACGVTGLIYAIIVFTHTLRQKTYRPVFEDWLWHVVLPFFAYALLLISAIELQSHPGASPFAIGASALLLLFIGIHNAWDAVTFFAVGGLNAPRKE